MQRMVLKEKVHLGLRSLLLDFHEFGLKMVYSRSVLVQKMTLNVVSLVANKDTECVHLFIQEEVFGILATVLATLNEPESTVDQSTGVQGDTAAVKAEPVTEGEKFSSGTSMDGALL